MAPIEVTLSQPDDTQFQARPRGDEYAHWMETIEGHTIVQQDGEWFYATRADDGRLVATSFSVGTLTPAELSTLPKHITPIIDSSLFERHIPLSLERREQKELRLFGTGFYSHVQPLLVILVGFNSGPVMSFTYSDNDFQRSVFGSRFSVKEYYSETSYNKLLIVPAEESYGTNNDGIVHVTLSMAHPNRLTENLVSAAFSAADTYINYARYDSDGDRYLGVDELSIILVIAGYEHGYGGDQALTPNVHAHRHRLIRDNQIAYDEHDNVYLSDYAGFGEMHATNTDNKQHQATIGVICHELGHLMLGLPDLYDYTPKDSQDSWGIGDWGLMGSGAWNKIGDFIGDSPAHLCAWSKATIDITAPDDITFATNQVRIQQAKDNADIKRLWIDPYKIREYFLLENRQTSGYDGGLPGAGLLIWHIDDDQTSNDDETHKKVDLEEADGQNHLDTLTNRGDQGDPYPGSSNNTTFSDTTNPNAKDYSGKSTGIVVKNISSSSSTMTADLIPLATKMGDHIRYDENGVESSIGYNSTTLWTALRVSHSTAMDTLDGFDVYISDSATVDFYLYADMLDGIPTSLLHSQLGFSATLGWNRFLLNQPQPWASGDRVMVLKIVTNSSVYPAGCDLSPPYSGRSYVSDTGSWYYQLSDTSTLPADWNQRVLLSSRDAGTPFITVTPSEGLTAAGNQGGPFSPGSKTYTLTNTGGASLNWQASKSQSWVSVDQTGGTLAAGGSTTVTVSINSNAAGLGAGSYSDTVYFTNLTNNNGSTTRPVSLQISAAQKVATPTFSPAGGTYTSALTVTISCTTSSATIRYTTDGSTPTETSTPYSAPISITTTTTLKARAWKSGWTPSDVGTAVYTIQSNGTVILADTWPSEHDDGTKWTTHGTEVDDRGEHEPSPPYSLHFNTGDSIRSKKIDLSRYSRAVLTYYFERGGYCEAPDDGDDFVSMYWNGSSYKELRRHLGNGTNSYYYEKVTVTLPPAAMHTNFMLRFEATGDSYWYGLYDDWFLDDVELKVWP